MVAAIPTAVAACHLWWKGYREVPPDPSSNLKVAYRELSRCDPERKLGEFKLFVAWWGRECDVKVYGHCEPKECYGPLCLTEDEIVAAAVRMKDLPKKPTGEQRNRIVWLFRNHEDYAVKTCANHADFMLRRANWVVRKALAWHVGGKGVSWRSTYKYVGGIMFLYSDAWGQPMPLVLLPDTR